MLYYIQQLSAILCCVLNIRLFGHHHVGGQKCIAVIERKALIVSLFTNASDYSSETTLFVRYKHIDLFMQVLL